jgi:hypothetical protein
MEKFPVPEPEQTAHRLINRGDHLVPPEDHILEATATTEGPDFDPKTGKPYEAVTFEEGPDFDEKTGEILEVTATEDGPEFVKPEDVGDVLLEVEPSTDLSVPSLGDNASGDLHNRLASEGLLEVVARIPEHDKRHVKDIRVQDLADLALAKYLETENMSSIAWKTVKSGDPRFLTLKAKALEIAQAVADNPVKKNLYVPRALEQMRLLITQAAAVIMNKKE